MSRSSFTECLFVGGPADGRRDMIADDLDVVYYAVSQHVDFSEALRRMDQRAPNVSMQQVAYWRKPLTAEGLRKPIQLFIFDKEASTGWLLQKLVSAYPSSK